MNIRKAFRNSGDFLLRTFWPWEYEWLTGASGKRLTSQQALTYAPIWYGCNKIAGHIAQLPVCVYKRLDEGAERDRQHNVSKVMRHPNLYQTSIVFREQIAVHSLLEGSGRAAIVRQSGRIAELIPLNPDVTVSGMFEGVKVHLTRPPADDRLRLFFDPIDDTKGTDGLIFLDDEDVLHIPGLSFDGVNGLALKDIASRNIHASINAEKRLAHQMEHGFSGNLMLSAPPGVFRKEEDAIAFMKEFDKRHAGTDGKTTGLLREGISANVIAMNNKDAEMIENRRFQRQDAALWLGLESILGDDSSVSYNSLEQKNQAYLINTLNKWLKRWEEEMEWKLLPRRQFDAETHYIRFNTGALLKSDYKSTIESLALAITSTIISPNEAREKIDMNPYAGGDKYANPNTSTENRKPKPATEDDDETDDSEADRKAKLVIQSHLQHLIGNEMNRVRKASKEATNFVAWLDNFYAKKWLPDFAESLEEIGMDRELATLHCDESKRRLLEVCDESMPENLVENVEKCVGNWKLRANTIGELDHAANE